jgi:hypothetical protein
MVMLDEELEWFVGIALVVPLGGVNKDGSAEKSTMFTEDWSVLFHPWEDMSMSRLG